MEGLYVKRKVMLLQLGKYLIRFCPSFATPNKKWASKVGIYNAYIIAYTNKKWATV
jgi:hypothetical protein